MAEHGVWVYAVCPALDEPNLAEMSGVDGEQPRLVRTAELSAIVGTVDLGRFGAEALRQNLNDLDRLEALARAHHGVVQAAAAHRPTVPTRLATVYEDDDGVRAMLAEHHDGLVTALRRIAGHEEYGVKAYAERAEPASPAPSGASTGTGAGTAYLRRRRAALAARDASRQAALAGAEAVHGQLSAQASAARRHRPQDPRLSGDQRLMVLNAAYLLDHDQAPAFLEAVDAAQRAHPELAVALTGPWPPYSFAAIDDTAPDDPHGTANGRGERA